MGRVESACRAISARKDLVFVSFADLPVVRFRGGDVIAAQRLRGVARALDSRSAARRDLVSLSFDSAFDYEPRVRLFDEVPELFEQLSPRACHEARARAVARVVQVDPGPWDPQAGQDGDLGALIIDGLVIRSIALDRQPRSELLGAGDLLRPWDETDEDSSVAMQVSWRVLEPTRLAVLDQNFLAVACAWPPLMSAVVSRVLRRSRWLALQLAIADLRRVEDRLMLLFSHFADRWGRVRPEGVVIPLPVTHDIIAQLVGAQRPTVTGALQRLALLGKLRRRPDRSWLLAHDVALAPAPSAPEPETPAG